jgi:ubiquinol-cytochrome c reductase cytochrome b subunit
VSSDRATDRALARAVRYADERTGQASLVRKALGYVFPDHWSFLFGEIALYSFLVLVGSGVFLTFFFEPSVGTTVYDGPYVPLQGTEVSHAYDSVMRLSFEVNAGLLMRQVHHWAALVFVAAIVVHLMRIFFTGAFRKPRDVNYYVGLTMLALALVEGFAGYSLADDLLSGMGLAIAYSVTLATPVVGGDLGFLLWGGQFPGSTDFISRLFIAHVLILPIAIAVLVSIHLLMVALPHHSQFRGPREREENVVGTPLWPAYALRSVGLMLAVAGALVLLGGLIQINPIWQWGPYEPYQATDGAQPDWYMGWLIGALRLMPPFEPTISNYTLAGNPFFGGALLPVAIFGFLYAWPSIERRVRADHRPHHLLDRPRDNPWRTGVGAALFTFIVLIFLAGSADRIFVTFGISYESQVWLFRGAVFVLPPLAYLVTKRICTELRDSDWHPLRPGRAAGIGRAPGGGFEVSREGPPAPRRESDAGPSPGRSR